MWNEKQVEKLSRRSKSIRIWLPFGKKHYIIIRNQTISSKQPFLALVGEMNAHRHNVFTVENCDFWADAQIN